MADSVSTQPRQQASPELHLAWGALICVVQTICSSVGIGTERGRRALVIPEA